ncbi:MAG: 2-amino-4-hydroxy-6-hydroxymethyldihydropteridine diphosphokinase [Candidatus Eremiobacteraeota bacterium]|nr:2-amino-4-hydroxy-6-hydroxymethyldihydropteridine diphosphokinase [Candidatus Eremiobacteraeota bacterium]
MERIHIGLGTNLGELEKNLERALGLLSRKFNLVRVSSFYETIPLNADGPNYLNAVALARTDLSPEKALKKLLEVENLMGRKRPYPNAPRLIDLDLLTYNDLVINTGNLVLPHPGIKKRLFVLVPLEEIDPDFIFPGTGESIKELLSGFSPDEKKHAVISRREFS